MKLVLDTDIGTDVDDLLALSFLLASPEAELLGVTTVYGDTRLRAKLAYRALSLVGREDVPVVPGVSEPLAPQGPIFWGGFEGRNARAENVPEEVLNPLSAPEWLVRTVAEHPGEVVLCAVGPLTNVARALLAAPEAMRRVRRVVVMGGAFGGAGGGEAGHRVEHNIRCDPEAAQAVFGSGLPITLFPLDVTLQTPLVRGQIAELSAPADRPLAGLLEAEIETFLRFAGRRHTYLHDPLAVAAAVDPAVVTKTRRVAVRVVTEGPSRGATLPHSGDALVEVVTEADLSRFYELFLPRASGPRTPPTPRAPR